MPLISGIIKRSIRFIRNKYKKFLQVKMLPVDSAESTGSILRLFKRSELSASSATAATAATSASTGVLGFSNTTDTLV